MRIYLDLDGVLADFDSHFENTFGHRTCEVSDKLLWDKINSYENFFIDLPLMKKSMNLFTYFTKRYETKILTSCPRSFYTRAALQKKRWVRKNFCEEIEVLPVLGGRNKALFMHKEGDILIDDMKKNCDSWDENGGISILHKNVDNTIDVFEKFLEKYS